MTASANRRIEYETILGGGASRDNSESKISGEVAYSGLSRISSENANRSPLWERVVFSTSVQKEFSIVIDNQSKYTLFAYVTTDPHSLQVVGGNFGASLGGGNVGINAGARPVIGALYTVHPESKRPIPVRTKVNYMTILRSSNENNKWFVVRHNREIKRGFEYLLTNVVVEQEVHLTVDSSYFSSLGIQLDMQEETLCDSFKRSSLAVQALTTLELRVDEQDEIITMLQTEVNELKRQSLVAEKNVLCCHCFRSYHGW